jgi:hypothetical protein
MGWGGAQLRWLIPASQDFSSSSRLSWGNHIVPICIVPIAQDRKLQGFWKPRFEFIHYHFYHLLSKAHCKAIPNSRGLPFSGRNCSVRALFTMYYIYVPRKPGVEEKGRQSCICVRYSITMTIILKYEAKYVLYYFSFTPG